MKKITNKLLAKQTQSRLCATFIEKNTGRPLTKIPVYAEISATVRVLPEITTVKLPKKITIILNEKQINKLVENLLIRYVDQSFFDGTDKDKAKLLETALINFVEKYQDFLDNNPNATEEERLAFLEEALFGTIKDAQIEVKDQSIVSAFSYPLGFLATNHAGYVSFDTENAHKMVKEQYESDNLSIDYIIYPYGLDEKQLSVLTNNPKITKDVIFGKFELKKNIDEDSIPVRVKFPSMQNPSLEDWYLSPSSFTVNPAYFLGEDGCENLYPANFATHDFRFFQIIRGYLKNDDPDEVAILNGWALEYQTTWQPLGHTLGQIIYSLPLAPGEIVKIAVIDWARKSRDSRDEDLSVKEQLAHNTHRERTISETVNAALSEWQRGGSIMGGNSGGAGVSLGYGGWLGFAAGNAHSFGGGYSTSSGDRNVTASTVQQASDAFSQHSASMRELRSTIVIQSDQKEDAKAETRVVANYNHSHALTMLYYEVLRHYKVSTEFMRIRNTLLVDYSRQLVDFNNPNNIFKYRQLLENQLLDNRFLACLDSLDRNIFQYEEFERDFVKWKGDMETSSRLPNANDIVFVRYLLKFDTMTDDEASGAATDGNPFVDLVTISYGNINFLQTDNPENADKTHLGHRGEDDFEAGRGDQFWCNGSSPVKWGDIRYFRIGKHGGTAWGLRRAELIGFTADNKTHELFNGEIRRFIGDDPLDLEIKKPAQITSPPTPKLENYINKEDFIKIKKLQKHLTDNSLYYNRAIWLLEDPNERAVRFQGFSIQGKALIDCIDNRPLEVLGKYVVFPSNIAYNDKLPFEIDKNVKVEKLMTLPTRGVFAEAKLGHCNASEIIDNTRFWDWQQSPIPEKAPEIKDVSTDSRNVDKNLTATQLPNSIVNIVNPSNLPDPTGLSNALNLLGKSDIFRDMSMSDEVTGLLKQLSSDAVKYGELATKAQEIVSKQEIAKMQAKNGQKSSNSSGDSGSSTSNYGSSSGSKNTPTTDDFSKQIDNYKKMTGYTDPEVIKKGLANVADNQAAYNDTNLKSYSLLDDPNLIASNNPNFFPATSGTEISGKQINAKQLPTEIMNRLNLRLQAPAGTVPRIVANYLANNLADVWSGSGGIIGVMFYNKGTALVEYLDNSVPSAFASAVNQAKPFVNATTPPANHAETVTFEDGGKFYSVIRIKEDLINYMSRLAHECCHHHLKSSESVIENDLQRTLFHSTLTNANLNVAAKIRFQFMGEVLGRRLNYLFHEATDGILDSYAKVTNETIGKNCFTFVGTSGYRHIDSLPTLLPNVNERRWQVGHWLQNFWTNDILFDNAVFDKKIKDEFNLAGHFLKTASQAEFDAVTASGIQ
jgi:hypothetical protein